MDACDLPGKPSSVANSQSSNLKNRRSARVAQRKATQELAIALASGKGTENQRKKRRRRKVKTSDDVAAKNNKKKKSKQGIGSAVRFYFTCTADSVLT